MEINRRPAPFSDYTAKELWTNSHTAEQMLHYHLNDQLPLASRKHAFIEQSTTWIANRFNLSTGKKVADFGCGPGLYAKRLTTLGAKVVGIDFSANSLEYARQQAQNEKLEIDYRQMNYLNFDSGENFDLIMMIMCDFCALSPAQRAHLLKVFKRHLTSDGRVLLDVYTLVGYAAREEAASVEFRQLNGFWSPDDYFGFVNTFKYAEENVILDKFTIVEAQRTRTIYNWLQYFNLPSLQTECAKEGFDIEEIYNDVAGCPYSDSTPEMAVVLRLK